MLSVSVPAMDYIGLGFNWFFVALTLVGYLYLLRKTGQKWVFMPIFAAAWMIMGISYVFIVNGTSSDEWYITFLRTIGYVLFLAMILTAMVELRKSDKWVK